MSVPLLWRKFHCELPGEAVSVVSGAACIAAMRIGGDGIERRLFARIAPRHPRSRATTVSYSKRPASVVPLMHCCCPPLCRNSDHFYIAMVTIEATRLCGGGLPASRGELPQVILVGQAGQPDEDVAQVGERVPAVAQAGDDQRVEDGGALDGVGTTDQQPVFLPMQEAAGLSQRGCCRVGFRRGAGTPTGGPTGRAGNRRHCRGPTWAGRAGGCANLAGAGFPSHGRGPPTWPVSAPAGTAPASPHPTPASARIRPISRRAALATCGFSSWASKKRRFAIDCD
jgi:hypothetical protein